MKRPHEEPVCSALPRELLARIIGASERPALAQVCQAWRSAEREVDWFGEVERAAEPCARCELAFTGPGVSLAGQHTMLLGEYVAELRALLGPEREACGLTRALSLFVLQGLAVWRAQPTTCLLQCALYYVRDLWDKPLAARHFHQRDFRINFFEEGHTYLLAMRDADRRWFLATNIESPVPGLRSRWLTSTTAMNDDLFAEFVEDDAIDCIFRGRRYRTADPTYQYTDMTREQIKAAWEKRRADGTAMHLNLEHEVNGLPYSEEGAEWPHYVRYKRAWVDGRLAPYRAEWLLYNEALRLTGSVDIVYAVLDAQGAPACDPEGRPLLYVGDWKRANELLKENTWQCGTRACTEDMQDSKISHYRVQLNNYRQLLTHEDAYGVCVTGCSIIGLDPAQEDYIKYDVVWEPERVRAIWAYWAQKIGTCNADSPEL